MKIKSLLFGVLLAFALPWTGNALTLSELRTEIRRATDDNPSNASFRRYSDTFLLSLLNEAQKEVVLLTDLSDKTTAYRLSPRTTYYALPSDFTAAKQVYFTDKSGSLLKLEEKAQRSLYDTNPNWDRQTGTPISYWISQSTAPQNGQPSPLQISYIPIPTQLSTGTVTIWYSYIMPALANDSDVPFDNRSNLASYHYTLVYYVVMRLKLLENKTGEATAYQQLYQNGLAIIKGTAGAMPNYRPGINIPGVTR